MDTKKELMRVRDEAASRDVTVNGWQEGFGSIPGFALVTDKITGTTFAVSPGQTLAQAQEGAQQRMGSLRARSLSHAAMAQRTPDEAMMRDPSAEASVEAMGPHDETSSGEAGIGQIR